MRMTLACLSATPTKTKITKKRRSAETLTRRLRPEKLANLSHFRDIELFLTRTFSILQVGWTGKPTTSETLHQDRQGAVISFKYPSFNRECVQFFGIVFYHEL